ncbi:hypothetical protein CMO91_06060 [Candidatus Woesearchaeota archaeon]|nr:hypothetical protein [Candidatus Woesearchaeota archaeon]
MKYVVIMLLLAVPCNAIVISHVLYDAESESTGEFVRLYNNDTTLINLDGWYVSTLTSEKDAVLGPVTLFPGQYYTVGDVNTSADHIEAITLKNTNAGVRLMHNNTIKDVVGWGNPPDGWYDGDASEPIEEGEVLTRTSYTHNNLEDFSVKDTSLNLSVEIVVENSVFMTDDSPAPGYQIKPRSGETRVIQVFTTAPAVFLNKTYLPSEGVALLPLPYHLAPKNYSIITSKTLTFEYLPLESVRLLDNKLTLRGLAGATLEGSLRFQNVGNLPLTMTMRSTLNFSMQLLDRDVGVGENASLRIRATLPVSTIPQTYKGTVSFSY